MGSLKVCGLTARLISKHFGNLGDTLAEAIASHLLTPKPPLRPNAIDSKPP